MAHPPVLRRGSGLKEFPPWGRFSTLEVKRKAPPKMPKFVVFWSALAASVATFALPADLFAAPEENISIVTLLKGDWQIAGCTSTLDNRSAFILFRHPGRDLPRAVSSKLRLGFPLSRPAVIKIT